jgi:uncharacterized protein with HEPN domain
VISEAPKAIPSAWKVEQPQIEWTKIVGLGNILRHTYHRASAPVLWSIYPNDLDPFEAAINHMLTTHGNERP